MGESWGEKGGEGWLLYAAPSAGANRKGGHPDSHAEPPPVSDWLSDATALLIQVSQTLMNVFFKEGNHQKAASRIHSPKGERFKVARAQ